MLCAPRAMPAYRTWSEYDACVLGETPAQTAGLVAGTPAAEIAYNEALRDRISSLELRIGILETKDRLRSILKDIKTKDCSSVTKIKGSLRNWVKFE